jgi:hypothetical protein
MVAVEEDIRDAVWALKAAQSWEFIPHKPTPRQKVFLDLECLEAFYGGAAGGGKTDALLMAALQYVHVPGYTALILMKTFADLSKPKALMDRAHEWLQGTGAQWSEKNKRWTFQTEGAPATLDFGYLQTDADKYNYRTAEYQFIGFDELTRFAKQTYTYLFSRLRKLEGVDVPIRMRSASNPAQPGEPGMLWVEERFIPEGFDPTDEARHAPRVLIKTGEDEETGEPINRWFVFARLEDNPYLDASEYEKSLSELDPVSRAQLRRGDWKIRHRGDIYWMWDERFHVISWEEFARVYRVRHIPDHWLLSVSQDQGTSEGHVGATAWFANAAANGPLPDTVFMYRAMTSVQESPSDIGLKMLALMNARHKATPQRYFELPEADIPADGLGGRGEIERVRRWLSSHEANSERLEYRKLGLPFSTWKAGPNIGLAQMRNRLGIIECDKPNPFRPNLMGRPRFMLIVPKDELEHAKTDRGMARTRAEFVAYHYAKLKSGEATRSDVPDAQFNDFMDAIREAAFSAFPNVLPLSDDEEAEAKLPAKIRRENLAKIEPGERARAIQAHDWWLEEHNEPEDEGSGRFEWDGSYFRK